jgi:hypothetical protein
LNTNNSQQFLKKSGAMHRYSDTRNPQTSTESLVLEVFRDENQQRRMLQSAQTSDCGSMYTIVAKFTHASAESWKLPISLNAA